MHSDRLGRGDGVNLVALGGAEGLGVIAIGDIDIVVEVSFRGTDKSHATRSDVGADRVIETVDDTHSGTIIAVDPTHETAKIIGATSGSERAVEDAAFDGSVNRTFRVGDKATSGGIATAAGDADAAAAVDEGDTVVVGYNTAGTIRGCFDGTVHMKVLDSGAYNIAERCSMLVSGVVVADSQFVPITVEGASEILVGCIGSHHGGDTYVLHQLEELAAVGFGSGIGSIHTFCQKIPLFFKINQIGVVLGALVFFKVDELIRGNGDFGIVIHVKNVAFYGPAIYGVDVTVARGRRSDVRERNRGAEFVIVHFVMSEGDCGLGSDARGHTKGKHRHSTVVFNNVVGVNIVTAAANTRRSDVFASHFATQVIVALKDAVADSSSDGTITVTPR